MDGEVRKRIERYIKATIIPRSVENLYDMRFDELQTLAHCEQTINAIVIAFNYGMAKGWRAAKAEVMK